MSIKHFPPPCRFECVSGPGDGRAAVLHGGERVAGHEGVARWSRRQHLLARPAHHAV